MVDSLIRYLNDPAWRKELRWRRALWQTMGRLGLTGLHMLPVNRRWIDFHYRPMPLRGLDASFDGMRMVQLSDLHHSPVVSRRYLRQLIGWVNELQPQLVVVTGDLITGGYLYAERVARLLSELNAPRGVVCTFGNHDYSVYGRRRPREGQRRADFLAEALRRNGLVVLRNDLLRLAPANGGAPLQIVGLDDDWSGALDAARAFAGVDPRGPVVCLNHNPSNCIELLEHPWQWMLAGHTHGRQLAASRLGRRLYPKLYRHFHHGYYAVRGRHLYVNRGVSYGQRARHWCRPEITVFRLVAEGDAGAATDAAGATA